MKIFILNSETIFVRLPKFLKTVGELALVSFWLDAISQVYFEDGYIDSSAHKFLLSFFQRKTGPSVSAVPNK
jgi:hypothetical protein